MMKNEKMMLIKFNAKNFVTLTDSKLQETNGGLSILGSQVLKSIIQPFLMKSSDLRPRW
jgi:hypothetical protein